MCGFTAFFSHAGVTEQQLAALRACNADMPYRGPDEQGLWFDRRVGLGHVRLSIIGVANGHQPMFSADKSIILVCNGEIYNYRPVREVLIAEGAEFLTESDCEVIIHLYRKYGEAFVEHLDGMFAFCLYDSARGVFIVARDRAGKKPLYYSVLDDGVVFSSEHKVIRDHFVDRPRLDYEVLRQVQQNRYSVTETDTFVSQIHKLPGGAMGVLSAGKPLAIRTFAERTVRSCYEGSYEAAVRRVRELLFAAVEKRLQAEVPLAILLSAGVDSSAIACVAKTLGRDVIALTAGYKDFSVNDESSDAGRLAREMGFDWRKVEIDAAAYEGALVDILAKMDEPDGDPAMFAQWFIYKAARELGLTVLLSGNGSDELFYGYSAYNTWSPAEHAQNRSRGAKVRGALARLIRMRPADAADFIAYMAGRMAARGSLFANPVLPEVAEAAKASGAAKFDFNDWREGPSEYHIDAAYRAHHKAFLPNNCYFLADKLAMAHSIEVRAPFADRELIDFVDSLPIEHKFPRHEPKGLLKDALRGVVPDYVLDRHKTGFTPPPRYVQQAVDSYRARFFEAPLHTLAQVATDYFADAAVRARPEEITAPAVRTARA